MTATIRRARRAVPRRTRPNPLLWGTLAVLLVAAVVALAVGLASDDADAPVAFDTAAATIDGTALPTLSDTGSDAAVGHAAPRLEGTSLDGETVTAPVQGRPTVLLFLAHWCPHCQREVPVVQDWLADRNLPDGVDLVAVATSIDPSRPNYPPAAWLESEGWTAPTIADATGAAASAYGLSAFPYWVAVDADGNIVERRVGELTPAQITELVDSTRN